MDDNTEQILSIYLQEYDKLKDEQIQRIGFRDALIYTTLGAFGALLSFVVTNNLNYHALLVAPWICVILGWTYLVNDDKISAIGRYIREDLNNKISSIIDNENQRSEMLSWETFHRSDDKRKRRKIEQFIIDQITFVFSGLTALVYFWRAFECKTLTVEIICGLELFLLLVLAIEIWIYADFTKDIYVDNNRG